MRYPFIPIRLARNKVSVQVSAWGKRNVKCCQQKHKLVQACIRGAMWRHSVT